MRQIILNFALDRTVNVRHKNTNLLYKRKEK